MSIKSARRSTLKREPSSTNADECGQRPLPHDGDVPGTPPHLPVPPKLHNESLERPYSGTHSECEGEWNGRANVEETRSGIEADVLDASDSDGESMDEPDELSNTSERAHERTERQVEENAPETAQGERIVLDGKADASPATWSDEDPRTRPKNLRKASERVGIASEQGERENSQKGAPNAPDGRNGETTVPHDVHNARERPQSDRNGRVVETNVLRQVSSPGGQMDEEGELGRTKRDGPELRVRVERGSW